MHRDSDGRSVEVCIQELLLFCEEKLPIMAWPSTSIHCGVYICLDWPELLLGFWFNFMTLK